MTVSLKASRWAIWTSWALWSLVLAGGTLQAQETSYTEADFLSRTRRLTFEGRRSGEGYFSSDGQRMVFQSEREPGNPFYQIYDIDLSTGETRRISPGKGKTTCSFFQAGTGNILFSSTHHDPRSQELQEKELALRASGAQRRYAWDYDSEMEIYVYRQDSGQLKRLTNVLGYDAEASYSPDGTQIAFTSNREAYSGKLDKEDQARLELNPSYFAEIYGMRADGSDQRRLTDAIGYDGGPFFFADGSRIVWRRFDAEGLIADIWTMRPDGSQQKQITDFGSMSWAPFPHPSGVYILFASNKLGFTNFELFMVDAEGKREPIRITYTDGFDGLPVPSPDGRQLAWTSNRGGGEGGQIFLASWDHERALEVLADAPLRRVGEHN